MADLWRAVWDQRVRVIVMITNLVEQGKAKCEQYWPDQGSKQFGLLEVTMQRELIQA